MHSRTPRRHTRLTCLANSSRTLVNRARMPQETGRFTPPGNALEEAKCTHASPTRRVAAPRPSSPPHAPSASTPRPSSPPHAPSASTPRPTRFPKPLAPHAPSKRPSPSSPSWSGVAPAPWQRSRPLSP
ncbi:early nodulin-20-like [Penaeus chinensis]|uniref:early nodulin-20-like n=1 Tax=Penaeus chinensis TaxID=139456 RepID=UPI001FB7633A|nr:early nodulin-20-like [Penaeus chinensis]